jgi:hypothetical protein
MKAKGAPAMAVAQDSIRGVGPTVVAGHGLIGDRHAPVCETGKGAKISAGISDVRVCNVIGGEAGRSDGQSSRQNSDTTRKGGLFHITFCFVVCFGPNCCFRAMAKFLSLQILAIPHAKNSCSEKFMRQPMPCAPAASLNTNEIKIAATLLSQSPRAFAQMPCRFVRKLARKAQGPVGCFETVGGDLIWGGGARNSFRVLHELLFNAE